MTVRIASPGMHGPVVRKLPPKGPNRFSHCIWICLQDSSHNTTSCCVNYGRHGLKSRRNQHWVREVEAVYEKRRDGRRCRVSGELDIPTEDPIQRVDDSCIEFVMPFP